MNLSLVIPIYNSQDRIEESINRLVSYFTNLNISYEILLRDDCSLDDGVKVLTALEAKYECVKCFYNNSNKGIGYTLRELFSKAQGSYVIYSDIDLPFGHEVFRSIIKELELFDVVVASRYINGGSKILLKRKISSRLYYLLCKVLFNVAVYDIGSGTVGFKKTALPVLNLKNNGFDVHIEIMVKSKINNLEIREVSAKSCDIGKGSFSIIKHGPKVVIQTIVFWFKDFLCKGH